MHALLFAYVCIHIYANITARTPAVVPCAKMHVDVHICMHSTCVACHLGTHDTYTYRMRMRMCKCAYGFFGWDSRTTLGSGTSAGALWQARWQAAKQVEVQLLAKPSGTWNMGSMNWAPPLFRCTSSTNPILWVCYARALST